MFYYTLLFTMSSASLFCLGAQVGRVWSSPYVLKVKFFPFIFQARSHLKQARDSIHTGQSSMPALRGTWARSMGAAPTECERWSVPTCFPVSFLLTCSCLGLTGGSAHSRCGPHGHKPASGRPWESTAYDFKLTSEVRLSDIRRRRFKRGSHQCPHQAFPRT